MSKVQREGLHRALDEAEALARVLRTMSDGKIDLTPVLRGGDEGRLPPLPVNWAQAKTEAAALADGVGGYSRAGIPPWSPPETGDWAGRGFGSQLPAGGVTHPAEMFCSVCGPLDEPGIHTQEDCPRQQDAEAQRAEAATLTRAATGRPQPEEGR